MKELTVAQLNRAYKLRKQGFTADKVAETYGITATELRVQLNKHRSRPPLAEPPKAKSSVDRSVIESLIAERRERKKHERALKNKERQRQKLANKTKTKQIQVYQPPSYLPSEKRIAKECQKLRRRHRKQDPEPEPTVIADQVSIDELIIADVESDLWPYDYLFWYGNSNLESHYNNRH